MAYTNDSIWKSVDWMTICIYLMLVIFGWFSVCGASYDYGEIDFFSFDTRAGKQFVWICCSLGLGFILMMLEDKLYDMFAYILYGGMMLLLQNNEQHRQQHHPHLYSIFCNNMFWTM